MAAGRAKTFAAGALVPNMGYYFGLTLAETAGAVAKIRLWDNATAASGTIVAVVTFTAASNANIPAPSDEGIYFANGLFAEVVSGTVEGSVYLG